MTHTRPGAFFDLDDTLIDINSMGAFGFHYRGGLLSTGLQSLLARRSAGEPWEVLNRDYYALWAGQDWAEVQKAGQTWFKTLNLWSVMNQPTLDMFKSHQARGLPTVLVTGSWLPCVLPFANELNASAVLCTQPVIENGILTGEVVQPMIGQAKADAIRAFATEWSLDLDQSYAYGDDDSDIPMLETVGHGYRVPLNPERP